MDPQEESHFRKLYATWSNDRLLRATTVERDDFRPELLPLIEEEFAKRTPSDRTSTLTDGLRLEQNRAAVIKDTLLFPARLNRAQYLARWLIWLLTIVGVGAGLEALPWLQPYGFGAAVGIGVLYRIVGLDLPRLRSIGWSPWVLAVFLVPLANLALLVLLFFAPPEE